MEQLWRSPVKATLDGKNRQSGSIRSNQDPSSNFERVAPFRAALFCGCIALYRGTMVRINDDITLLDWELSESFMRASGPGGQNVNKVSSAVELRFEAERSPSLTVPVKIRLKRLAGRRWTLDGALILQCDETRSQARNRELVRQRLADLIRKALVVPKRRIATRPTLGSKNRRIKAKKVRGEVKNMRGKVDPES